MTPLLLTCATFLTQLPLAVGPVRLWYALPLVVSVSLVYSATREEEMGAILNHAARFGFWLIVFMAIVLALLQLLTWGV